MSLHESGEMYLETILVLSHTLEHVRSVDVADHMNFSKPSVSRGMKLLREEGYISVDGAGYLTLTDSGREVAEKIYDRHRTLSDFLVQLGVDRETAVDDACKMEHVVSDATMEALKKHIASLCK